MKKTNLENNRQALVTLGENKMEGVLLRSRARWIGRKITKSFCGLEKRNYVSKQMFKRSLNSGEEIYETKDIIKEVKTFSERLYSNRLSAEDCEILDMVACLH